MLTQAYHAAAGPMEQTGVSPVHSKAVDYNHLCKYPTCTLKERHGAEVADTAFTDIANAACCLTGCASALVCLISPESGDMEIHNAAGCVVCLSCHWPRPSLHARTPRISDSERVTPEPPLPRLDQAQRGETYGGPNHWQRAGGATGACTLRILTFAVCPQCSFTPSAPLFPTTGCVASARGAIL